MVSETWEEFFKRELEAYNSDWSEDQELIDALTQIMEQNQ